MTYNRPQRGVEPAPGLSDIEFLQWLDTLPADAIMHRLQRERAYTLASIAIPHGRKARRGWRGLSFTPQYLAGVAKTIMAKRVIDVLEDNPTTLIDETVDPWSTFQTNLNIRHQKMLYGYVLK